MLRLNINQHTVMIECSGKIIGPCKVTADYAKKGSDFAHMKHVCRGIEGDQFLAKEKVVPMAESRHGEESIRKKTGGSNS
jgi:hypothetical protein